MKRRENNYDVAQLWYADRTSRYYEDSFDHFDEVKIYLRDASETAYTQIFGGYINQIIHSTAQNNGFTCELACKGYGAALEYTNCNRDYGEESSNPGYPHIDSAVKNVISDFTNKSFDDTNTGWALDNSNVSDYLNGTDIKYINNPYRSNLEVINLCCTLGSAIGAGTTAGPHWIVDTSKNFLFAKIGDHAAGGSSPEALWPDYWQTDAAGSTLEEGVDFTQYALYDKKEEFANNIILVTDFRKPSYDYYTEKGGSANPAARGWGSTDATLSDASGVGLFVVGADSMKILTDAGDAGGYAFWPSTENAAWDIEKWGSVKTIPHLNFYMRKDSHFNETLSYVAMFTTDATTDFYYCYFSTWSDNDDEWVHKSIPVGPYWASSSESRNFRWASNGAPDWGNINGLCFGVVVDAAPNSAVMYVDDLHFNGKIIRSAYNSYSILGNAVPLVTAKNEHQKVLISRNAMDDSCVAADDSGFAALIAYGELLRRQKRPRTIVFTTSRSMKAALPGQKIHVHCGKKADYATFRFDRDCRILQLEEACSATEGTMYRVTATTDLLNSCPISTLDQFEMWQENMFMNSKEAKNIRSGAEVDLLIPMLKKDYASDDDTD